VKISGKRPRRDDGDPVGWRSIDNTADYEGPLTPQIATGWLTDEAGISSCGVLVRRHGLRRFSCLGIENLMARDEYVEGISFAIPCREAIGAIQRSGKVVEVGAGTGFWTALIRKAGGDIIATDVATRGRYKQPCGKFAEVRQMTADDAVDQFHDRNVLAVWPCYDKPWAGQMAKRMRSGRHLFLVSEGAGGCVGDDALFDELNHNFELVDEIALPVWPAISDYLSVHRKR